jgi:hypothetical protein
LDRRVYNVILRLLAEDYAYEEKGSESLTKGIYDGQPDPMGKRTSAKKWKRVQKSRMN